MATELKMTGNKQLGTLSREFSQKFNYLTLIFRKANNHALDATKTLAEVREKDGGEMSIVGNLTIGKLEQRFEEYFGLNVQVACKKKDGLLEGTGKEADKRTLSEHNEAAKNEGYLSFV
jgi:hypothetical protein